MGIQSIIVEEIQNFNSNFKNWFGNSKVVDEQGNPLICYHGTSKGSFTEFQPKIGYKGKSKQQVDLGSHFSADKEYASGYAGDKKDSKVFECYLRIENPLYTNQMFWREDNEQAFNNMLDFITNTFKKHANINGDNYYDKRGNKQNDVQNIMLNGFLIDKIPSNQLYTAILEHGFDGVFHEPYNMENLTQFKKHPNAYIVLNPNQIKSIDNQGQWSTDDDDILNEVIDLLEGVGDKYLQNKGVMPDTEQQDYLRQTASAVKPESAMGEFVGYAIDSYNDNKKLSPIYKNPTSLQDFEAEVRAITDKEGNIYVAQFNGDFTHGEMENVFPSGFDAYDCYNNMSWHRVKKTNNFGFGDTMEEFVGEVRNNNVNDRIKLLNKKHSFNFIPKYFSFIKDEEMIEGAAIGDNSGYMQMVDVVAEEIQNIDDGVGDKYAQKQFGIPDSGEKFEKQWQRHQSIKDNNQENGKFIATINYDGEYGEDELTNIYLNPKTLKNFDADVKAITDKDGNLYIAQHDVGIFHETMGYVMKENGYDIGHAYNVNNNATWHRLGNSNEFGFSISFVEHFFIFDSEGRYDRIEPEHQEKVNQTVEIAKRKNPQFEFLPMYWSFYRKKESLKF